MRRTRRSQNCSLVPILQLLATMQGWGKAVHENGEYSENSENGELHAWTEREAFRREDLVVSVSKGRLLVQA